MRCPNASPRHFRGIFSGEQGTAIENLRVDFIGWLMGIMVMPALFMLVPLSQGCFSGKEISISVWLMVAAEEDRRCAGVQRQGVEKGDRRLPRAQVVRRTDPADPAPEG